METLPKAVLSEMAAPLDRHNKHMFHGILRALLMSMIAGLSAVPSYALINPRFTPVHLVDESDHISHVELVDLVGPIISTRTIKVLKGSGLSTSVRINLSRSSKDTQTHYERAFQRSNRSALVFISPPESESASQAGLVLFGTMWARITSEGGSWFVEKLEPQMSSTWAGSSEMLARAVEYILSDPAAEVPVAFDGKWKKAAKIAKMEGKVHGILKLQERDRQSIFVLCENGDRLLAWNPDSTMFKDKTAGSKLTTRSRLAAWGDLNHDGLLDAALWDGTAISAWLQATNATFHKTGEGFKITNCVGLALVFDGARSRMAILANDSVSLVMLEIDDSGRLVLERRIDKSRDLTLQGMPGAALVADFTGDGIPDAVEPYANGLVFYQGQEPGLMRSPTMCRSGASVGARPSAFCGDYDADGLLDLIVAGSSGIAFWGNQGTGHFREVLEETGEPAYITKPRATGGFTCDINNDGRQDFMVSYENMEPQFFFNRGFRTFGFSSSLTLDGTDASSDLNGGQQATLLTDINANGEQDLICIGRNNDLWLLLDRRITWPKLALTVTIDPKEAWPGPLVLTAWKDKRCLGSYNLLAGTSEAFYGIDSPGTVKLQWKVPGSSPVEKHIEVKRVLQARIQAGELHLQ